MRTAVAGRKLDRRDRDGDRDRDRHYRPGSDVIRFSAADPASAAASTRIGGCVAEVHASSSSEVRARPNMADQRRGGSEWGSACPRARPFPPGVNPGCGKTVPVGLNDGGRASSRTVICAQNLAFDYHRRFGLSSRSFE